MTSPKIQTLRYVSSEDLVGHFSVILWDNCPYTLFRSTHCDGSTETLSLIDLNTFQSWVNDVVGDWEGDAEAKEKFNEICNKLSTDQVYVKLDSEVLLERSMDGM